VISVIKIVVVDTFQKFVLCKWKRISYSKYCLMDKTRELDQEEDQERNGLIKGATTSKIKHAIKLKTSPARLAQLLRRQ